MNDELWVISYDAQINMQDTSTRQFDLIIEWNWLQFVCINRECANFQKLVFWKLIQCNYTKEINV